MRTGAWWAAGGAAAALVAGVIAAPRVAPLLHVAAARVAVPPPERRPAKFGINLADVMSWSRERSFANLVAGGEWKNHRGGYGPFPQDQVDLGGNILRLDAGEGAATGLTRPAGSYEGQVRIRCTWLGRGEVHGIFITHDLFERRNSLDFTWTASEEYNPSLHVDRTDPADPVRDIDCREAKLTRTVVFAPDFIDDVRPYAAIRFLDWQRANANLGGDWARRTPAGAPFQDGPDGVAVEHMVALANAAGADPWFVMPWKATPEYLANFARYVHDHLDPQRIAYVEIGNEIWNGSFAAAQENQRDAQARGYGSDMPAAMRAYGERAAAGLAIWEKVYGADRHRLVRVMSGQAAWPEPLGEALDRPEIAEHADAVAIAPYFGLNLTGNELNGDLDAIFRRIDAEVDQSIALMARGKAVADRHGKRLLAYEAGQHLLYFGPDGSLMGRINRDPRMGAAYRRYMAGWARTAGDLMCLFQSVSPISNQAAFGLAERSGQPLAETPKRAAVLEAIAATKR